MERVRYDKKNFKRGANAAAFDFRRCYQLDPDRTYLLCDVHVCDRAASHEGLLEDGLGAVAVDAVDEQLGAARGAVVHCEGVGA